MFPKARNLDQGRLRGGVKIAVGPTHPRPARPQREELVTLVGGACTAGCWGGHRRRGRPDQRTDRGPLAEGLLADIIAVRAIHWPISRYTKCLFCNEKGGRG
jgi:hypothetical protein